MVGKRALLVLLLAMIATVVMAQGVARDYAVVTVSHSIPDDGSLLIVQTTVRNNGAAAEEAADLSITNNATKRILGTGEIPPLAAGEEQTIAVEIPIDETDLRRGQTETLRIEAGIDRFELAGLPVAEDNTRVYSVVIPVAVPATATPEPNQPVFTVPLVGLEVYEVDGGLTIGPFFVDANLLPVFLAGAAIVVISILILVLLLIMALRRPRRFTTWNPPYANVPPLDPATDDGRRQGWQQHANNGSILTIHTEGQYHVIKRLESKQGRLFENWTVAAARLVPYDMYGRVLQTQGIAGKGDLRPLNRALRRLHEGKGMDGGALKGVARRLVKAYRGQSNKHAHLLPLALDLRFTGQREAVRILFVLYQYHNGTWGQIDQWEPLVGSVGRVFEENYTFTIHGMAAGESRREYFQRLETDVTWLLENMLKDEMTRSEKPATYDVPDTLTGMAAVSGDDSGGSPAIQPAARVAEEAPGAAPADPPPGET
jgi:hypothetical protein